MAQLIPKFLASAFERMGNSDKALEQVAINTGTTAAAVSVGGDLYEKMDELVKALGAGGGGKKGDLSIKEALVLRITAGALEPIGLGLGVIIDALERAPDGKELKLKMEALTNGLLALGEVGYSIVKFAAMMILALPLLIVAGIAMLLIVPILKLMVDGLMWATKKLDKKQLKKIAMLGEIGVNILILAVSLVLVGLLATFALKGVLVAAGIMLGLAGVMFLLDKMGFDPKGMNKFAKALKNLALGILGLSVGLILIGFLTEPILYGLGTAMLIILTIGGVFWLMDKMKVAKSMRKTGRALVYAAMAILSVSVALVLSALIVKSLGWLEVGKVLLMVGAVAMTFFVINKVLGKQSRKGAMLMIFAAGAILAVSVALFLAKLLIGPVDTKNALKTFGVLVVLGAVALVFGVAGLVEKQIKSGAIAMMFAGGAMIVIAIGVYAMKKAIADLSWSNLGMIAAIIGGLAIAMGIAGIGPIPAAIALGSAAMIVAGLALVVIGAGVKLFSSATKDLTWEKVGMMGAIIGGIAIAMAAAGLAAPFILIGSAAMLVAGAATIAMGLGLLAISKLDFSSLGSIDKKGNKPFNYSGEKGFFGGKKTNFEVAMDAIADGMSLGPLSIAGIAMGAPMLILAGAALVGIVKGIRAFSGIAEEADLPGLKTNVRIIVSGLADTFAEVGKKYPGGGSSLLSALTGNTSGQSVVAMGISAVGGMGKALTGIARGVQAMANLKFPTGFDKDGNPTGYETIDIGTVVPGLIKNTQLLVAGLSSVFSEVGKSDAAQGSSWFSSSTYEKGINVVKQMGTPLYNLANGVQAMANLKFPTGYDKDGNPTGYKSIGNVDGLVKKLAKNTKALIIGLAGVFEEVGKSGVGQDGGWFSSSNFEKGVEIAMQLGEPYTTLSSVVDDVVKITSKITDAQDVKEKVTAIISAITDTGGQDMGIINAKKNLIATIGGTYKKLGTAIPAIVSSIASFTVDKAKSFASIFGGESPAELFETKTKFLKGLTASYLRMAVAIPLIVGSINTVSAEQLDEFTAVYGGRMDVDTEVLNSRSNLFLAVGSGYEKMGKGAKSISSAVNATNIKTLEIFKNMFVGRVSMLRPVAGYEAQTELWNAIGVSMKTTGGSFPSIAGAINSMDLAKLTEARTMFEALAVLSKGGDPSDILAEMGESLEVAMQRLADILQEFQSSVQANTDSQGGFFEELGDAARNLLPGGGSGSSSTTVDMPSQMSVKIVNLRALARAMKE